MRSWNKPHHLDLGCGFLQGVVEVETCFWISRGRFWKNLENVCVTSSTVSTVRFRAAVIQNLERDQKVYHFRSIRQEPGTGGVYGEG